MQVYAALLDQQNLIYISADWSGNSKLIVIPNMTHELPNRKYLNIALDYLNATDG